MLCKSHFEINIVNIKNKLYGSAIGTLWVHHCNNLATVVPQRKVLMEIKTEVCSSVSEPADVIKKPAADVLVYSLNVTEIISELCNFVIVAC